MNQILRTAWTRWQIIAHINGDYLARFVTNLFFFTILVPFAIGARLFSDPLALRKVTSNPWSARKAVGATPDDARSQF